MARRPLDNYTITQGYSAQHPAIDLAAPHGTPVKSPVTGTVIGVGRDPKYIGGLYVIVREDHADKWEYYTGHHSEIHVGVGQRVSEGQVIAKVGATGQATGPHTHFQVRQFNGGAPMHPDTVLNARNPQPNNQGGSIVMDRGDLDAIYLHGPLRRHRSPGEGEDVYLGKKASFVISDHANSAEGRARAQGEAERASRLTGLENENGALKAHIDGLNNTVKDLRSQLEEAQKNGNGGGSGEESARLKKAKDAYKALGEALQ